MSYGSLFPLLIAYQLKHFLADYPLQSNRYMLGKFRADWGFFFPLLVHVGVHAVGTLLIALSFGKSIGLATTLALFDGTIHFSMDRIKASPQWMGRWKPLTAAEWVQATAAVEDWYMYPVPTRSQEIVKARSRLTGNKLFWNCLGFDQLVHHLTHYACIWGILR